MSDPKQEHDNQRDEEETKPPDDPIEYFTKVGKDDSPTSDAEAPPTG